MRARVLKRLGIGFLMGVCIGNLVALCTGRDFVNAALVERMGGRTGAILLQTFLSGLYGAVAMGGTAFYEIDRWPLALATGLHCLLVVGLYIPLALTLNWCDAFTDVLIVAGIQLVVFMIIWLIIYLRYKAEIRELNGLNQKRKKP